MNSERPILKLKLTKTDRALDRLSIVILAITWIYTIAQYAKLPRNIPTHFDFSGKIDSYGSKATLFILPAIVTIVIIGMTVLNNYPHLFNYTQKIKAENAEEQYTVATRLLRIIKLVLAFFSLVFMISIVNSAMAGHSKLYWWIIPVFMIAMVAPIIIFLFLATNKPKDRF